MTERGGVWESPTSTCTLVQGTDPADPLQILGSDLSDVTGPPPRSQRSSRQVDILLDQFTALEPGDPRRPRLRSRIVEEELPLVHHLAQRFRGRGEPYDDLLQVGTIGLLNAIDRFDPARGNFTSFAVPTILGEIRRHFRDKGWALHVPRRLQELGRRVNEGREVLTHVLGRSPTVEEIAQHLNTEADLVVEALDTAFAYATVPLPTTPLDIDYLPVGSLDEGIELVEHRETLRPLLAKLPARERHILALRFIRGMSQSQIASEVGMSQMSVSRLLSRSLATMRECLTEDQ
jgi:RNA polymerase sigma-B factor